MGVTWILISPWKQLITLKEKYTHSPQFIRNTTVAGISIWCWQGVLCLYTHPECKNYPWFWNSSLWLHPLTLSKVAYQRQNEIPAYPGSQFLRKDFSRKGRSGGFRQLLCLFTAPKSEDDVKELTLSLLLLRPEGQTGARLNLRK